MNRVQGSCWHDWSQVLFVAIDLKEDVSLKPVSEILVLFTGVHIFLICFKSIM